MDVPLQRKGARLNDQQTISLMSCNDPFSALEEVNLYPFIAFRTLVALFESIVFTLLTIVQFLILE